MKRPLGEKWLKRKSEKVLFIYFSDEITLLWREMIILREGEEDNERIAYGQDFGQSGSWGRFELQNELH